MTGVGDEKETRPFWPELVVIPSGRTPADRSLETRRIRKQAILNIIRAQAPVSRANISQISGFNIRTTSLLVDELVSEGLLYERDVTENARGRPPTHLFLNESAAIVMGIDIGRQRTIGRLMDLGGKLLSESELQSPSNMEAGDLAEWARKVASTTISESGGTIGPLCGIGVGIPPVLPHGDKLHMIDKATAEEKIQRILHQDYPVEVLVDRDSRMMALGSLWFGVGKEYDSFALLKIGVGLGLSVVKGGRLLEGASHRDLELGHVPLGDPEMQCYCGSWGCIEGIASGTGVERLARERGLEATNAQDIATLAREGNEAAREVFSDFAQHLGRGVATVINLFSPEAIVLSGRMSRAADLYADEVKAVVARHTLPSLEKKPALIVSDPNARLGALGAVSIVYNYIFHAHHVTVDKLI